MLLFDITSVFSAACASLISDPNLLNYINQHERKNIVLSNLCEQVISFEKRFGSTATLEKRNEIIFVSAKMFVEMAKKNHEELMWSQAEKQRQLNKVTPFDDMKEVFREGQTKVITDGVTKFG